MKKVKIKCSLLAVLLLGSSAMVNAGNGIKRSEWSVRTELSAGDVVIGDIGMFGLAALAGHIYKDKNAPWWFPSMCFRQANIVTPECKDKFFDLSLPDYSIGETVTYMSKNIPLGFWGKLAYEHQGFKPKKNHPSFSRQMIVPEFGVKIRFGNYRTSEDMYMLDIGACYDYVIGAKGKYDGTDAVNSGFTGIIGFGLGLPDQHWQIGVTCYFPFYHYFNRDFTPDGGQSFPYSKWDTKTMTISWYIRYGF